VQFVAALDKQTGRLRWKTHRTGKMHDNPDFRKAYCTPLITSVDGREQLVSPGADRVIAYNPADGGELWRVEYQGFSIVPRPVRAHNLLFVTTAFARPELWAVRTGAGGDATETHVAWKLKKMVPSTPSPLVVGDELYLLGDKGILTCVNAHDGTELWSERIGGNFSASPLYADGKIYLFSEAGQGYVLKPGKAYHVLAENHLDGRIQASPAATDGALFVRTDRALYRLEK
jgi:outer membrane protein assembly factor BamB